MTWPDVSERAARTVVAVPVGSTEQHGPHLPLGTDTAIAVEVCRRLAGMRADVVVAPAVAYGSSGEHAAFPGTLSIGAEATETVLVEVGRSADAFAGIVFVSAHGGNAVPVARAAARLRAESRRARAWSLPAVPAGLLPSPSPAPVGFPGVPGGGDPLPDRAGDAHAGWVETSVMLCLDPPSVRPSRAEAGCTRPLAEILPELERRGVAALSPNGVLGDPEGATEAAGRAVLEGWVRALMTDLEGWP